MEHRQFLRIKKLKGKNIILVAAKHNLREIAAEIGAGSHIDAAKICQNVVMRGPSTAVEVESVAEAMLAAAGCLPLRKDAVRALEIIYSLPPAMRIDHKAFFNDSIQWSERYFGVPILSAVMHLDEDAPHLHVLLVPLIDGRMVGSDLMGNPTKLRAMQASFYEQVSSRYGMARKSAQTRLSARQKRQAAEMIVSVLRQKAGALDNEKVVQALADAIAFNPESLLAVLGLPIPVRATAAKSFVKVMTRPCKPEKAIGFDGETL